MWGDPDTLRGRIETAIDPIMSGGAPEHAINETVDYLINLIEGRQHRRDIAARMMQTLMQGAVLPTKADRDTWLPVVAEIACEAADALLRALAK